jgi:hypothetical protein
MLLVGLELLSFGLCCCLASPGLRQRLICQPGSASPFPLPSATWCSIVVCAVFP